MELTNNLSDELLARYIEGNVSDEEAAAVRSYLNAHPEAFDQLLEIEQARAFAQMADNKPSAFSRSTLDVDALPDDIRYQLPNHGKRMVAASNTEGNPTCAIAAQQMVLNDYGIHVSQIQLLEIAKQKGWFIDQLGTPLDYVGELLNHFDVQAVQFRNANIYHVIHELSQGHRIIVGLDANALSQDDRWRTFDDVLYGKEANHVLVVGGIDTSDPDNLQVVLSDPTNPEHNRAYPADKFLKVWEESGYFMVSTTQPVPQGNNQQMSHFDYRRGHISQFADIGYDEIVRRLDDIYYQNEKSTKLRRILLGLFAFAVVVGAAVFFAWSYFTPINVRVSLTEDQAFAVPNLPFQEGKLTLSYANVSPITTTITGDQPSALLDNIAYKNRKSPLHIQFAAVGFCPIDTVVAMEEAVTLQIRRNDALATLFGYVQDEQGAPVANATLTIQDIQIQSDSLGYFRFNIPPAKQKQTQSLQALKAGFEVWTHHQGVPSASEPYYIILKKIQ